LARGVQEHFFGNLLDCFLQLADDQHAMKIIHIQDKENLNEQSWVELAKRKTLWTTSNEPQ
jgi:hypothetical protein